MMCTDFIEAEQLQTELAMEPRVFSVGTAYPKGEHCTLGLWVRQDAYSGGMRSSVTPVQCIQPTSVQVTNDS